MHILRAANYKTMPWKNGMGFTTEIAVSPGAQGLDGFDWRISMARVEADGPFSLFPDIDRTLLVLEGDGIDLSVADREPVRLDRDSIHCFPGDQAAFAALVGGPIVDLNIMTRRGQFRHSVSRFDVSGVEVLPVPVSLAMIFVERGVVTIAAGPTRDVLAQRDAVLLTPSTDEVRIESTAPARLVMIVLERSPIS